MADEQYPLFKNEPSESTASTVDQLPIRVETHHSINSEYESLKGIPRRILQKRPQSELKKILKPKQPVIKRYFTAGVNVNEKNARKLEKEPSPFAYPQGIEELAYKVLHKAWRNDERIKALQQKCFNRPSYKDRQRRDLLNRLYVEKTPTSSVKTVTDINPDYFKIVQGKSQS